MHACGGYIDVDDLINEFGEQEIKQLTDRGGNGVIDMDVAAAKIGSAQEEVDGWLAGRFEVPFEPHAVPGLVRELMLSVTYYRLFGVNPTEHANTKYDKAIARLKDISAGRVVLDVGGKPESTAAPKIKADPSPVGDAALDGYRDGYRGDFH